MTKPRLVLVHGRAQGGKSAAAVQKEWMDTLVEGLGARRSVLDGVSIDVPFYGDQLDDFVEQAGQALPADMAARGSVEGIDPEFLQFQYQMLEGIRQQENLSQEQVAANMDGDVMDRGPLNWRWVQAIMRTLNLIPGLDGDMIERFTRDVWIYLTRSAVRSAINGTVGGFLKPGEKLVVIAHSLGSVVAYDILRQARGIDAKLLITVGSPLGIDAIRKRVAPLVYPAGVQSWFNGRDDRDAVALYPLDTAHFGLTPPIMNFDGVHNRTDNAHGISGYLNDSRVVEQVHQALL